MESISILKYMPRRLLVLYSCCLSLFFLCAFFTYSVTTSSNRPIEDSSTSDDTLSSNRGYIVETVSNSASNPYKNPKIKAFKESQENTIAHENQPNAVHQQPFNIQDFSIFYDSEDASSRLPDGPRKQPSTSKHITVLDKKTNLETFKDSFTNPKPAANNKDSGLEASNITGCAAAKPKLILLWTPFFEYWGYLTSDSFSRCKDCRNCLVTTNRSMILESDAVIFHVRDISLTDLPPLRLPHQRWIFYCLESPPYSDFPGLEFMHRMFNWTMTYRLDSDIISNYGSVKKVYPRRPLNKISMRQIWQQKTKSVVWMSSHCPTHAGRDDYVNQLKKYIDIDEYGWCGELDCPKNLTTECLKRFASTYKFFLAFENSICKDYITEKFFRTLSYDMVPVVFGGASYRKIAPPGSYIDALSFKSPKHLAYFLVGVGKDFDLYSTYFEWRKDFAVRLDSNRNCELCSLLHQNHTKHKVYEDIRKWWVYEGACQIWKPKI